MTAERQRDDLPKETVESAGRKWARERAGEMRAGLERSIKIVKATDEYVQRRSYPSLTGMDRPSDVKFDAVGNLYTSWWQAKKIEVGEDGRRLLFNPRGSEYLILFPPNAKPDLLVRLPKGIPVVELILGKVSGGVEASIRQMQHILEEYAPAGKAGEVGHAKRVIAYVDKLTNRFISERVTTNDLEALASETGEFLEAEEVVSPRDPNKRKIYNMLLAIPQKDTLGRVNPLVSRIRARAAYIAATKRLVVGSFVVEKFSTNLEVLLYERELTRWTLESAVKDLEIYILGTSVFRSGTADTKIQRAGMANMALTIAGQLGGGEVRVKPYLAPARRAAIDLVGGQGWLRVDDRKILPDADELFSKVPVISLINDGQWDDVRSRLKNTITFLRDVLQTNESIKTA